MRAVPGGLIATGLRGAMGQPGCPICRLRDDAERRYLRSLLWENVNDPTTRDWIRRSMGFCPRHTWQMGRMEVEAFGSALGNSIIYEDLVGMVRRQLAHYVRRTDANRRSIWRRWLGPFLGCSWMPKKAQLQSEAACRVCQIGLQTEASHVRWLLGGLSNVESAFCEWYRESSRLCLRHLDQALMSPRPETQPGVMFLAQDAEGYLERLEADLGGFGDKHSWDRRHEPMTEAEKVSWLRALAFFGGNERNHNGRCGM